MTSQWFVYLKFEHMGPPMWIVCTAEKAAEHFINGKQVRLVGGED